MLRPGRRDRLPACPIPATVGEMSRLPDEFRLALNEHTELMAAQLAASPGNERIIEAIIQNQQMKESVVNNIIAQVSQTK